MAEKEYIEVDLLKMAIEAEMFFTESTKAAFRNIVNKVPAADVAPVVRCRDCVVPHNKWTGCPHLNGLVTPQDFYCGFGRRADNG